MARYNSAIVLLLQTAILVSSSFALPTDGHPFSLEDRLQQLTENYIKISDAFAAKDARFGELEAKMTNMELKFEQQQKIIFALQQKMNQQTNLIHSKSAVDFSHPVAATGMPKSCADLRYMGHTANGLYLIMGTEMVETAYCDFSALPSDPSFQTWIGQVDVKSQPVYFYVQRNTEFKGVNTPITFQIETVNIGNAMNLASGKFTAPRTGVYSFSFTGYAHVQGTSSTSSAYGLHVGIYLNGNKFGSGNADEVTSFEQYELFSLHWTLNLQRGDQVWLQIYDMLTGSWLYEDASHYNQFSGWLLEEKISQSLSVL